MHVMVDGTVVLVSLFYFYFISVLYQADAPGKGSRDGGRISGASVASVAFLLLPYFCSIPRRRSWKRAT
jgi:hypothetical protein